MSLLIDAPPGAAEVPPRRRRTPLTMLGACSPALASVLLLLVVVRAGLPAAHAARALAAVVATQLLPGLLAWRCIRPRHGWWLEDVAMGSALGTGVAVLSQAVAGSTGWHWLAGAGGLGLAAALGAIPATRQRIRESSTAPLPGWWGLLVSLASIATVPALLAYDRAVPLRWPSGFRVTQNDVYFHLALAGELAHHGPERFPFVVSEPLAYHWFSHAWIAQVATVSGIGLDEVLFRFMPAVLPVIVALAVAVAAVRLSGVVWTGPLAAVLTMIGGDLNAFGHATIGYPVAPFSPSLGLSAPVVLAIVVLLALRWRGDRVRGGGLLLAALTVLAAGTKGSTVPLILAGLGLASVAMLFLDRSRLRAVLIDTAIVAAGLVGSVAVIFRGSATGLRLDPATAVAATPAVLWIRGDTSAAAVVVLAVVVTLGGLLARGVGVLGSVGTAAGRRDPMTWLLVGAGLVGAGAVVVFAHPGNSQWYFIRSADPLLALGSALGLVTLVAAVGPDLRRVALTALVAGPTVVLLPPVLVGRLDAALGVSGAVRMALLAAAVIVVACLVVVGPARRRGSRLGATLVLTVLVGGVTTALAGQVIVGIGPEIRAVPATQSLAVSRDEIDAARWIRDHSDPADLVMTNRHCSTPKPRLCDSRRFVVAAFTERRVLVEGWNVTPRGLAGGGYEALHVRYWHPDLLALNDRFVASPTAVDAGRLRRLGVRWVYADATAPRAPTLEPWAHLRFRNSGVDVYELPDSAAARAISSAASAP